MGLIDLYGCSVDLNIDGVTLQSLSKSGSHFVERVSVTTGLFHLYQLEVELNPPLEEAVRMLQSGYLGIGFSVETTSEDAGVQGGVNKLQHVANQASGVVNKVKSLAGNFGFGGGDSLDIDKKPEQESTSVKMRRINVRINYGGKSSGWFRGILLAPQIEVGLEGFTIKLNGVGYLFQKTKQQDPRVLSGKGTSIVRELLGDGDYANVQMDSLAEEAINGVVNEDQINHDKNDYDMATEIIKKANCIMTYDTAPTDGALPVVNVKHKSSQKMRVGDLQLTAYRDVKPNSGIYPILGLSCNAINLTLPDGAFGKKFVTVNSDEKKTVSDSAINTHDGKVNKSDNTAAGGGKDMTGQEMGGFFGGPVKFADSLKGIYSEYTNKVFEYEILTTGIFDLAPGRMISIGVANIPFLSGTYDINEVTHSISTTGAETKVKLFRTGGLLSKVGNAVTNVVDDVLSPSATDNHKFNTKTPTTKGLLGL